MNIIDTHVHIFERPYGDVFDNGHIKQGPDGERRLFEQYRRKFGIAGAFVIGYEDRRQPGNNAYLRSLAISGRWIRSFGYVRADPATMLRKARELADLGHFGISCYLERRDGAKWLASRAMVPFWDFLRQRRMPISFNLSAFQCRALARVVADHPGIIVLISHMGRPKVVNGKLDERDYAPLLALAGHASVYVKLSGFYAYVKNGWHWPQRELFCVVDRLRKVFGAKRLLFASDFSPVLEHNTYRQALELLRTEYGAFGAQELADVYGRNAKEILEGK
ncbi:MAG: amidohydrolase family protein [Kiritimatiellaeota bacterium]|nr:amidohydrolase family protein [Kiritimatiellota bacterium]